MVDIIQELNDRRNLRDKALSDCKTYAIERAKKKYEYRVALAKRILVLRSEGVQISCIQKIAEGNEDIANLEMEKDTAESLYDLGRKAVDCYQLDMRLIGEQIEREYR